MKQKASDYIPQRYPFQLIDQFIDVNPGHTVTASKLITINEWYFKGGQFNITRPILIEMLAQTGVAAILSMKEHQGDNVFFGGIRSAIFNADVQPGDELTLNVELVKMRKQVGVGDGQIIKNEAVICEAELIFAIE